MLHGLGRYCERFGRRPMTQAGLKCLQALPIAHAALAVKESAKMSASARNAAMSKSYQEISAPGWIRILELAEAKGFRFPTDYKDRLYYTTLGTGKKTPKTFMERPDMIHAKFAHLKTEYTKGAQLWFATHQDVAAELPSGSNTQDALTLMEKAMYLKSDRYRKEEEDARDEAAELFAPMSAAASTGGALPTPAASTGGALPTPAASAGEALPTPAALAGEALPTPAALAAMAADLSKGTGEPGGSEPSLEDPAEVEVPDDYNYTWILVACAWAPWGGSTPSEWKYLMSSSGPKKRKNPAVNIPLDDENPISSPSAMCRVNANGQPASRRQHNSAAKKEKDRAQKEQPDKENKEARREALKTSKESVETRKASLAVLAKASAHVETIGLNLQRMVAQADAKAKQEARTAKIAALEKKLLLRIGNKHDVRTKLEALLDEEG